ncbi:collagen-binding protein [Clostridium sp. K25]|uniref:Cna B-type protein n=1 Tax=Clostridium botulinum D str. 1873 TaxID=592027 RepID=A0A9P2LLK4_CLOBO|nr:MULTISPECIES: carboxypeptidase regulatory-like domain-containing protein [Clostridium]EES91421.1 putative Cna B-type protein [Clostridium botulinum D str. 1873]KEI09776.1 collagen-binding protein [Clostridium sp. K25]MBO3441512.1 carboxypeptidase regulatory-like domain-containing protein [Clostridium haemolyticum]MCD3217025.1 carboxypeptidase regulatory-like domain-containing protein [Clostridium botulinum C]NFV46568.1 carboxypeptidase regulatory-like domain-containing protein [Clostridium 
MPNIYQDKYILGQSASGTIASNDQEIRLDLQLQNSTGNIQGGNISGTVTGPSGNISGAYIKLMSNTYAPLRHTITDSKGNYSFKDVVAGSYYLFAISNGMNLEQSSLLVVKPYHYYVQDFTLTANPSANLAIIAGDLTQQGTQNAINGAIISLFANISAGETLQAITYSNQYGQFVFRDVPNGNYIVRITALSYESISQNVTINSSGKIVQVIKALTPSPIVNAKGTVSGIITDANGQPINRADVILYREETSNHALTPIAFTKTNAKGVYLFVGVEPGTYKVKSNERQEITVNI